MDTVVNTVSKIFRICIYITSALDTLANSVSKDRQDDFGYCSYHSIQNIPSIYILRQ